MVVFVITVHEAQVAAYADREVRLLDGTTRDASAAQITSSEAAR